jgi:hypothetical protein
MSGVAVDSIFVLAMTICGQRGEAESRFGCRRYANRVQSPRHWAWTPRIRHATI